MDGRKWNRADKAGDETEVIKMGGGKKRREKAERAKKHAEYLREKKLKRKETKTRFQAPVKKRKK